MKHFVSFSVRRSFRQSWTAKPNHQFCYPGNIFFRFFNPMLYDAILIYRRSNRQKALWWLSEWFSFISSCARCNYRRTKFCKLSIHDPFKAFEDTHTFSFYQILRQEQKLNVRSEYFWCGRLRSRNEWGRYPWFLGKNCGIFANQTGNIQCKETQNEQPDAVQENARTEKVSV